MRTQYHLRPSRRGLYAWDVDNLIEATKHLPVIEVALEDIPTEKDIWPVANCKAFAGHMRLVLETDLDYPIILAPDNRVMDGLHRIIKAYFQGHASIKAIRFDTLPPPDYENVDENALPYKD